jgi:hypothetical protein
MGRVYLVSCAKQKVDGPVPAAELYVSDTFKKARAHAEANADRWFILSAKHHLLAPTDLCSRYEKTLVGTSLLERKRWADRVLKQLLERLQLGDEVTFLAGKNYRAFLVPELEAKGFTVRVPMEGIGQFAQKSWLKNPHAQHVERFYELLDDISRNLNGPRMLGDCCGRDDWPDHGVYFLFEPGEMRRFKSSRPRVVRIGTHGLRTGGATTLWSRLIQHRGTADGYGNHSSSIYREHVGAALFRRDRLSQPATWGGRSVTEKDKRLTRNMEGRVSKYLATTHVLWLGVDDAPGPQSDRAIIERNAIALLSKPGHLIDPPSVDWLGRYSTTEEISTSGLWNVKHVGDAYESEFLDRMERHVNRTQPR